MLQINLSPFPEIETERLLLRKIQPADAMALFFLRSDERVMQFIDKERATSIKDAEQIITNIHTLLAANDGITWAMAFKENPAELIGSIGLWRIIKQHHRAEIGYMLHPDHWKKGLMKEAVERVNEFGFNELKLHSIEAHINPGNTGSAALLEHTGYTREAYFKEDFFFNGTFRDTAIYSKLQ